MRKPTQTRPREVTAKRSMADLIEDGWVFGLSADPPVVQEHTDGSWTVHYPEEGWIQTRPGEPWPLTQSYWPGASGDSPFDLDAACAHARSITGREPKIDRMSERTRKRAVTL